MKSVIDHIALLVDDLQVAEEWYVSHLKGEVTFRDQKYIRLKVENTNIALIDKKWYPHAHIGILIDSIKDFPENAEIVEHRDGTTGAYVKDPFNNYLEYIWYSDKQKKVFLDD